MNDKRGSAYRYEQESIDRIRKEFLSLSEDDQDEELFYSNESEVDYALQLIRAGFVPPNIFSSPDWLREIEQRFKSINDTPSLLSELVEILAPLGYEWTPITEQTESNYPLQNSFTEAMSHLQEQWQSIDQYSSEGFNWRESANDVPNYRDLTTVHAFIRMVFSGDYPTPELLLSLAKSFDLYFTAAGELSLEEVFFGPPKQRAGNFAGRSVQEHRYLVFHDIVRREGWEPPERKLTMNKLAEKFLTYEHMDDDGNVGHFDVDTFLRGYRRWRKDSGLDDEDEDQFKSPDK